MVDNTSKYCIIDCIKTQGIDMSNFTQQTKSQLAKLLATENLRIEHRKMKTAAFDTKNRVLYCPIWKDMSGVMYDLLMGHEVGHALYTPAEGWHEATSEKGRHYKSFLNVVEDARIEKKIKRRYPGLRPSFVKAYGELIERDFFGIAGRDINSFPFIDRLNIYTKSDYTMNIMFNRDELAMIERVVACESWDDVLKVTDEVWEYSKDEQQQLQMLSEHYEYEYNDEPMSEEFDDIGDYDEMDASPDGPSKKSKNEGEGESEEQEKSSTSTNSKGDLKNDDTETTINRDKESTPWLGDDMFVPTCETDDSYRHSENLLLDDKSKDYVYLNIPTPNMERIITPHQRVHELINQYRVANPEYGDTFMDVMVKDFKNKNERYISLLAKEFEMKKAAKRYAKSKIANTGDIDVNQLYKYKIDDNIFRKINLVPNGKSHGLVIMFDRSGSMCDNMRGSIEQMLVLVMFCRKVNIPFVVYGFGNAVKARGEDFPSEQFNGFARTFSNGNMEIDMTSVYLREYMNSKMSNSTFNTVLRNMIFLSRAYTRYSYMGNQRYPASEALSNTPMCEAFVALEKITKEFRKVNSLDIVNTVLIHDGDSDATSSYFSGDRRLYAAPRHQNVYLNDSKSNKQYHVADTESMQECIMKWYSDRTHSKIFGFFITGSTRNAKNVIRRYYADEEGVHLNYDTRKDEIESDIKLRELHNNMKKEKLLISYKQGYSKFFLILGGEELNIDDDDEFVFDTAGKVTANKLANAFLKHTKNRQINRVLVTKFIDGIAT